MRRMKDEDTVNESELGLALDSFVVLKGTVILASEINSINSIAWH